METNTIKHLRERYQEAKRLFLDKSREVIDLSVRYTSMVEKIRDIRTALLDRALESQGSTDPAAPIRWTFRHLAN